MLLAAGTPLNSSDMWNLESSLNYVAQRHVCEIHQ